MKIETLEVAGFAPALRGMRNPKDSWHLSDSYMCYLNPTPQYVVGANDMKLAQNLIKGGTEHRKFLRMINVWFDADMPRYFWQEFDTYHHNTKNSCSTMHKLLARKTPITKEEFVTCHEDDDVMEIIVTRLEEIRKLYRNATFSAFKERLLLRAKRLLPEGFLQLRTVCTNYEELRTIYHQRKHHRLEEEWIDNFCKWVESLPYADEFIIK